MSDQASPIGDRFDGRKYGVTEDTIERRREELSRTK